MRIEGVIAVSGMVTKQATQQDGQVQRERAQVAAVPAEAQHAAKYGEDTPAVGQQLLAKAVDQVGQILSNFNETTEFKIHKETNATIVSVVNKDTGEVIRQIPSEKFLDLVAMFQKQLSGLHVDVNQ